MSLADRRSLHTILLLWLLPLMAAFMLVAWFIHGVLLDRMTRDVVHERLHQEARFLEKQIRQHYPDVNPALNASPYFEDVFRHAYGIRTPAHRWMAPAELQSVLGPALDSARPALLNIEIPATDGDGGSRYIVLRQVFEIGGDAVVTVVAEDLAQLSQSQRELHIWTAFVALGLLAVLIGLVLLAVHLALKPIRQLRLSLEQLQQGRRKRLTLATPPEFDPLLYQINHLLDTLDNRLQRSRDALGNLSHSIKTPIAVIQQALEDTERPLDARYRAQLAERLSQIDRQLEAEMRRSQFAGPQAGQQAHPIAQARELLWMMGRLYRSIDFELHSELAEDFRWPIDEQDLSEILGNLLDNAGKWARRRVDLTIHTDQGALTLRVSDDGPGVADTERATLGTRGLRLDEQVPGHGLGLAILRDLVDRYHGAVIFHRSPRGGLQADVVLPPATE
ncbi:ATP-binding protein [Marinobacter bohaiensis]|uniref:ATP-binding protein n=1 Tax=Marinobacter bohaiensis TaxID=2201898 RepID=UPI000DAC939D|nr:sensor histidine kinase [Marinobacter bohaiensis]